VTPIGYDIQKEIREIDGNIMAFSIVQKTRNQARTMEALQLWTMKMINAKLKEQVHGQAWPYAFWSLMPKQRCMQI
jgi:hypothetical protein